MITILSSQNTLMSTFRISYFPTISVRYILNIVYFVSPPLKKERAIAMDKRRGRRVSLYAAYALARASISRLISSSRSSVSGYL